MYSSDEEMCNLFKSSYFIDVLFCLKVFFLNIVITKDNVLRSVYNCGTLNLYMPHYCYIPTILSLPRGYYYCAYFILFFHSCHLDNIFSVGTNLYPVP